MAQIKIKTIIEIIGTPKEHVEETIQKVLNLMKESKKFILENHELAEPQQIKSGMEKLPNVWSTFGEFEIQFSNLDSITDFCFEFMPSSIEIMEPENIKLNSKELEGSLNDVIAKLHQYDMVLKKIILQQQEKIKKNEREGS